VATAARSTGVVVGAVGSTLTNNLALSSANHPSVNGRYIDPRLPKNPDSLLKDSN
jgi:hypothetical protein